jgi:hypothetical protein
MDRFLNVSHRVGPGCPNHHGDVKAVQQLLALAISPKAASHGFGAPHPSGRFDPLTAFYIYFNQDLRHRANRGVVIDGCVSPAHGATYSGMEYTIMALNSIAFDRNRPAWEELIKHYSGPHGH